MQIREHAIADEWFTFLPFAADRALDVVMGIERNLNICRFPGLTHTTESASTSALSALFGSRRDFLVVSCASFPEHRLLVSTQCYGAGLGITRYVLVSPTIGRDLRRLLRLKGDADPEGVGSEMDLFERADFAAFLASADHAVRAAISSATGASLMDLDNTRDDLGSKEIDP